MSDSAKFDIQLEDGVSRPAKSAAQALTDLRSGLDRNKRELSAMNSAMRELRKSGDTSSEGFKKLKQQIEDKTKVVGSMRAKYVELGGTFRKVKTPTKELSAFQKVAEGVPGPIGALASRMQGLGKFMVGGIIAAGVLAIGAALVGLAAAAVTAGVALVTYGIHQADARRSEALRLEGLTRLRHGYRAAGGSATEMQAAIDRVSDSSSASRSTLEGYASRLHRLGLRGDNFTAALEGMATRGEVLGDRYAQSFAGMAAQAARSGRSVRALANDVQARLGDIAGRKMIALDVTMRKFSENLSSLFRNVKIEGFLKLFREFAAVFSQARVTGRALAGIMERLFAPLDRGAENSVGTVRRFFTVMVTNILRVENMFLQAQVTILEVIASMNAHGITFEMTMRRIRDVAGLWGAAFVLPFTLAGKALGAFIASIEYVQTAGARAGKAMRNAFSFDTRGIARNLISGLVSGITSGTGTVISAITGLAGTTVAALREALQIRSPSRVFAGLGREIPRGLAMGVDAGSDAANASVANMIDVATGDVSATVERAPAAGLGGTTVVTVGDIYVTSAATDGQAVALDVRREIAALFEGLLVARGEPV